MSPGPTMHAAHGLTSLLLIPPEFVLLHGACAFALRKGHEHIERRALLQNCEFIR